MDIIAIVTYSMAILFWFITWKYLVGYRELQKIKLLYLPFLGSIFVFAVNIILACFSKIPPYETELSIYAYVEGNATTISGLGLAIAIFVVIEFKEVGHLIQGDRARNFLSLLLWSFIFSIVGCLPLYWMPPIDGWLTALRHIKTVPYIYSLFILTTAIITFISELGDFKSKE